MKYLLFFISFLLISCTIDLSENVNPSKIIGSHINEAPYGKPTLGGYKYINGVKYFSQSAYYKNKVLVYVYDKNGIIINYFFSDFVEYNEVKNIPLGSTYIEVINMLGDPVYIIYRSDYDIGIEKGSYLDVFSCTYYQKSKNKLNFNYGISNYVVAFLFNNDSKLINIIKDKHTE